MALDISGEHRVEVVGESFYRDALRRVTGVAAGGTQPDRRHIAVLIPDPANPYDRNAVKVVIDGQHVGHLPRELAALVVGPLTTLNQQHGSVTTVAEVKGSDSDLGFGVALSVDLGMLGLITADAGDVDDLPLDEEPLARSSLAGGDVTRPQRPSSLDGEIDPQRRNTIERAVEKWKSDLIDLTARNRLLYFRDLQTGTLSLDKASRDVLMRLVAGKRVALSQIVPRSLKPSSPLAKLTPFEDAVRRTRAISRTARSYEEERGVRTLFLACGMATWKSDRASRPPASPVLLVPMEVRARGASQLDFDLSPIGDLEVNPTLLHLLRIEHGLDVDEKELFEHADMDGVIDTPEELRLAYDWLSEKCATIAGWAIAERFVLGNFWYAKLPMVRDLEGSIDVLSSHDVAAALAGDAKAKQVVLARRGQVPAVRSDVDDLDPATEFNVLDSDSSQSLAIARALGGEDLVLRGPPGTGKSQTIANLISGAIGEGKRVLFVAEKRAAIDAVTKRLNMVGLDALVLDLHRGAESRKWLATQLGISLEEIGKITLPEQGATYAQLARARGGLREHARELHKTHLPWGASLYSAQMQVLALGEPAVTARLRGKDLESLTDDRLDELHDLLRDLLALKGLSLAADGSRWAEADVKTVDVVASTREVLERLSTGLPAMVGALVETARVTELPSPASFADAGGAIALWDAAAATSETFDPAIFDADLEAIVERLEPLKGSALTRMFAAIGSSEYRSARDLVRGCLVEGVNPEPSELFDELVAANGLRQGWEAAAGAGQKPKVTADLSALETSVDRVRSDLIVLAQVVGRDLLSLPLADIQAEIEELRADHVTLGSLPRIDAAKEAFTAAGLKAFLGELESQQDLIPGAEMELRRLWWQSIVDHLMLMPECAAALAAFRGERHGQVVDSFRELDRAHVESSAFRVRRAAAEAAVRAQDEFPEQAQLVQAQAKRKRGHMPVRELFAQAPNVVTALRPCWVMSPLMVSQLIPSDQQSFDIVVFDEASQVRPVDALSSMIRGRQLVVAGDEHQLPPTAFFDLAPAAESEDSKLDEGETSEIGDYESLLDVLITLFETEMLRWHYRSRDERLIGFSNQEFYGNDLTTFPGIVGDDVLSHVLVDQRPGEGEERVSPVAEVERIVKLILEHARTRPDESLGVIALGIRHAEAIDGGLLAVLPDHPELEAFFAEDREERFFVKNLERVQGDERDAIILAVGYGKTPDGELPHRFGPLNNAGGERRLNVAVTRAKRRMTVVSSFKADEIDLARSSARGVALLKSFLAYAGGGGVIEPDDHEADAESTALHRRMAEVLAAGGFKTEMSSGASTDRIDVAVIDDETGRPAVAIEIDGPSYATRPSVRDRDRLRAEQLERLGWGHVMTWSQDWFRDAAEAGRRLVEQVASSLDSPVDDSDSDEGGLGGISSGSADSHGPGGGGAVHARSPRPVFASEGSSIASWRHDDLVSLAKWIESDGLLRTGEELQREMMEELGITRRGSRVVEALDRVVSTLRPKRPV